MTRTGLCLLVGIVSALLASWCAAQETQVPLDEQGQLMVIDRAVETQLRFFTEYPGFQSAKLLQLSDSSFVLEIEYSPERDVQLVRIPMTLMEMKLFRARISGAMMGKDFEAGAEHGGRTAFLLVTTALSLGYYGWTLPYALDIEEPEVFTGVYLLTSGAGFFGPLLLTRNRRVTDASATLSFYGGTRGAVHGIYVDQLLYGDYKDFRRAATTSLLTSVAEYAVGFVVADRTDMSGGTAEVIGAGGDFGLAFGWGAAYALDIEGSREKAATALACSGLGLYGGHLLSRWQNYTRGDAYFLRAAVNLLAYDALAVAGPVVHEGSDDETNALTASAMAGGVGGIVLGHYLARGKNFTTGQGVLIHVGEFTGALFGLGLALVAGAEEWGLLYSSAAGATGGFFLTYYLFAPDARKMDRWSSLHLELCPPGLMVLARHDKGDQSGRGALPLLRLQYRF